MKKVILDFNIPGDKDSVIEYIIEKLELPDYYSKSTAALYDYLTDLSEPTAVGFFMPTPEYEDIDIEYLMYIEEIKQTFLEAERDGDNLAVIFGDLPDNFDGGESIDDMDSIYAGLNDEWGDDDWDADDDWDDEDWDDDDDYSDLNRGYYNGIGDDDEDEPEDGSDYDDEPEDGSDYNDIDLFGAFRR